VLAAQHYHWYSATRFAFPRRVASRVNYSRKRTESSSEHYVSDLSFVNADAYGVKINSAIGLKPTIYGSESECATLPTIPQRPMSNGKTHKSMQDKGINKV